MNDDEKLGRAKGGIARAEALSPEDRASIAKKAAKARWAAKDMPIANYAGVLRFGEGLEFPCAVLSNGKRVLTETDFMAGMGIYRSGALSVRRKNAGNAGTRTPLSLAFKNLAPFVKQHLGDEQPELTVYRTAARNIAHGIPAEYIPKICEIWMDARSAGVLGPRQDEIARRAEVLLRALAHVGIVALVDEATGYQDVRPQQALQQYLEHLVRKELAAWVKRFPDEFYENIYKLKGWPWPGMGKNRYSIVAHYTRDLVYERLAPGVLAELERKSPRTSKGHRPNKLHQWLTDDVGHPMLAQHLHSLIMFQRLAISNGFGWQRFVKMVDQVLPKKGNTLELPLSPQELLEGR